VRIGQRSPEAEGSAEEREGRSEGRGARVKAENSQEARNRRGNARRPAGRAGARRGSAQQEEDHTRPKSMWERVTSHCCGCMGQVEQASVSASTALRRNAHSADKLD